MSFTDDVIIDSCRLWAPPPELTLSQWVDEYRFLSSESAAEPGKATCHPFQREPLDSISDPRVRRTVVKSCTQLLKTFCIENTVAYYSHQDPSPILVIQPGDEDAKDFSKERIAPMIRDTPVLVEVFGEYKAKVSDNTIKEKTFPGGMLAIAGAGSVRNVARRAIRILCFDEVDKYKPTAEGNIISLAGKRKATFRHRGKEVLTCSPTVEGSNIDDAYEHSDKREYYVPCPACGKHQSMMRKFQTQVRWSNDSTLTNEERARTSHYHCEHCDAPWTEAERQNAVEIGEWRAHAAFSGVAGFWISELYSPWKQLWEIVLDFLNQQSDLQSFINTSLAENWEIRGETPEWKRLYERAQAEHLTPMIVPTGALFLTAAVDVQAEWLAFEVKGWGPGKENWSIYYEEIRAQRDVGGRYVNCRSDEPELWDRLRNLLEMEWSCEGGGSMPIWCAGIDSGHNAVTVYDFCRNFAQPDYGVGGQVRVRNRVLTVLPTKGGHAHDKVIEHISDTDAARKRAGMKIVKIGTIAVKDQIFNALHKDAPVQGQAYPAGYCHHALHGEYYFRGICAETRVQHKNGDVEYRRHGRNEPLDLAVINHGVAELCGISRLKTADWEYLRKRREIEAKPIDLRPVPPPPAVQAGQRRVYGRMKV